MQDATCSSWHYVLLLDKYCIWEGDGFVDQKSELDFLSGHIQKLMISLC